MLIEGSGDLGALEGTTGSGVTFFWAIGVNDGALRLSSVSDFVTDTGVALSRGGRFPSIIFASRLPSAEPVGLVPGWLISSSWKKVPEDSNRRFPNLFGAGWRISDVLSSFLVGSTADVVAGFALIEDPARDDRFDTSVQPSGSI
jgi:hypothetical protein